MLFEKNFIASAKSLRTISMTFSVSSASTDDDGKKYIPAGTYYTNDGDDVVRAGIVLDDVYFKGDEEVAVGSLIVAGHILRDRLPKTITDEVVEALAKQGLFFELAAPTTVTPDTIEED